ncbi:zinc finger, CCHC-type containing protein [Tanacetum coccineum]
MGDTVKDMTAKFEKLDKFEGNDFRHWQKKMHFLLTTLKVVYVLSTPMPEFVEDEPLEQTRKQCKWENDDYICRGHILNEETLRAEESDKGKGKEIVGSSSVNMIEDSKNKNNNKNTNGKKRNNNGNNDRSNKKSELTCWKCGKTGHFKRDCRVKKKNGGNTSGSGQGSKDPNPSQGLNFDFDDAFAWWIDSGATCHACKDRCWFETFHPVKDGSVLHMGNESTKPILGRVNVILEFSSGKTITLVNVVYVPGLRKNLMSSPVYEYNKYILSRRGVFVGFGYYNNDMFMLNLNKVPNTFSSVCMISSIDVDSSMWHARLGHVYYKRMLAMSKNNLNPDYFRKIDLCDFHATPSLGNKKYVVTFIDDASRFCYVYLCHAKDEALDKFKIYKTEVELQQNDLIKTLHTDRGGEYYDPIYFQSVGIIHETTTPYTPQQNGVSERKNRALKEMVNSMLSYSVLGCRAVVRFPEPKRKILGEKESRDAMFDEKRFTSMPRPKSLMPSSNEDQIGETPSITPTTRRSNRARVAKSFGSNFQLYLVEGSRDETGPQYSYCYSIEEDPRMFDEATQSRDVAFWKEAINDEMDSIMENNTWILSRFTTRLVIQGFRQKEGIDYFDTYAPVARISIIRLLIALASTYNLVIHQMDVKTTFLNGDLEEGKASKQWHHKFDEVFLILNESDKCIYCKFDKSDNGVIICLYVDDMLIFGTDQDQVDKTKEFLSSNFSMNDMGEGLGFRYTRPDIAYYGKLEGGSSLDDRKYSSLALEDQSWDHLETKLMI